MIGSLFAGIFLNPSLAEFVNTANSWTDVANEVWKKQIRPFAVGTMIIAAFYTLYKLKNSLFTGISKAVSDLKAKKDHTKEEKAQEH